MTIPLILDVDTGIDDSLALLYACASPEVELVAVTCMAGNVGLDDVVANTLAVLELAGRGDVPVAAGPSQPLVKTLETTSETHGPRGIGHAQLRPARRSAEARSAAELIAAIASERPGEVGLVTLGPLTNLALALDRDAGLPSRLAGWALMGGAYRAPGNTTPTSEWNIYVDPDAAKAAVRGWGGTRDASGRLPLAMGLDVTEKARILPADVARFAAAAGASPDDVHATDDRLELSGAAANNTVLRFVVDALRFYFEFHARYDGFYGAFIHDPFAVAAMLDRSLVTTREVHVDVEAGPGLAHAMTVADWRGLTGRPPNLDVAVDGDAATFLDHWIERVGRLAASRPEVAT
jgi:purine nucleosidase